MAKTHHDLHADDARRAVDAYTSEASKDLEDAIADLIADLGHLCMAEQIDFLAALNSGIRRWAVERINPTAKRPGPTVEVTISVQGLAPRTRPKARDPAKSKRSRVARDRPSGT
jgi:hypothetical protein